MKTDLIVSLKKFSSFILNNYQDQYIKKVRELTEHTPGILLTFISELSEEEKQEFFRIPSLAYLIHLSLNRPEEHVEENMLQWKKDPLPPGIRENIQLSDILKVLSLRKEALIRMLPFFTRDQKETIYLILQLENYHRKIEKKALAIYESSIQTNAHSLIEEVTEKVPGIIFVYDMVSRKLIYINKQIRKFLGYTDKEIYEMGKEATCLIIHPDDHDNLRKAYKKLYRNKSKEYLETEFRMKDKTGKYTYYLSKHKIFKLSNSGTPMQIIGSLQEISKRKEAEFSLIKTENLFKEAQNLAKIGNFEWSTDSGTIYWSEELYRIHGLQLHQYVPSVKNYLKFIHPEDIPYWKNLIRTILQKEKLQYEFRIIRNDGNILHIYGEGKVIKCKDGTLLKISGYMQDVTERKSFEEKLQELNNHLEEIILERTTELRKSEERFRFLAECSPQIVWTAEVNGEIDYANEKWFDYSGLSPDQTQNNAWMKVTHPDDIEKGVKLWEECIQTGKPFEIIHRLKRNEDQVYRWHITRSLPLKTAQNSVVKWFGTTTDIHNYKLAEESIKLQSQILDNMAEGVCVTDEEGVILYTNPAEEIMFGYERGELTGKNISILNNYPEEQQQTIFKKIQERIRQNNKWLGELNNIRKDKTVFTTYTRISSLKINENTFFVYVQEDVTESKLLHENQKLLEKVSVVLSSSLDYKITLKRVANLMIPAIADWCIIDMFNPKGKISRVEVAHSNPLMKPLAQSVKKFLPLPEFPDYPPSKAIYSDQPYMLSVIKPEEIEAWTQSEEHKKTIQQINPKSIISVPLKIRERMLGALTLGISDSRKRYNEKDLTLCIELARRVSFAIENALLYKNAEEALKNNRQSLSNLAIAKEELSRINEELSFKNNELIKINNDLDNFIYTASHDLKAPISNLEGLISILSQDMISENGKEVLPMIHTSLSRLKNVIKELTEISKIQKNLEEDHEKIFFSDLTQEVKLSLEDDIRANQVNIITDFSQIDHILFSKKNLRSIIYNLISNGIKYSDPQKESYVKIFTSSEENGIILTVEDNGLGIAPQNQEKIFSMFKRLHDHVEGTGVGLYIVKRIIENEGGKIRVESEEGKGSAFHIWFPPHNPTFSSAILP